MITDEQVKKAMLAFREVTRSGGSLLFEKCMRAALEAAEAAAWRPIKDAPEKVDLLLAGFWTDYDGDPKDAPKMVTMGFKNDALPGTGDYATTHFRHLPEPPR